MGQIQAEFRDQRVYVVAVNTIPWGTVAVWKEYWQSKGARDVIWATDTEQELVRMFQVTTLGTTIIIDRQGSISYRDNGVTSYETLLIEVARVL